MLIRSPTATVGAAKEPGWVTAVGVLAFAVMVWGFFLSYSISQEANPKENMFTSAWASK